MKAFTILSIFCLISISLARDCSWLEKRLNNNNVRKKKANDNDVDDMINRIYPYHKDLESLLNFQIRNEMNAFYSYLSMAHFFGTEENDLEGFYAYFHAAAMEELKHAEMFMKYQAKRGARNHLYSLAEPERQTWRNGVHVLKSAFELEKNVTDEILCLHKLADDKYNDVDLVNFLEGEVIPEQYSGMKELQSHIKSIQRLSAGKDGGAHKNYGLAEFEYDKKFKEAAAAK